MKKLAVALLILAVVGAGIYAFFYWAPSRPKGRLPEIVSLVPAESEWIAYVDLEAWRNSAIPEQLEKMLPAVTQDAEYGDFVKSTGFEYSRDLTQAAIALLPADGTSGLREQKYQVVAFAEGRFDRERITRYAMRTGAAESVAGISIIQTRASNPTGSTSAQSNLLLLAFLSDERVAIVDVPGGEANQLQRGREAILAAAADERKPEDPATAGRVTRIAGAPFFVIGHEGALREVRARLESTSATGKQAANALADLRWLAIAARPEQDQVRMSMVGECDSVLQATQLELLLHGLSLVSRSALNSPKSRGNLSDEQAEQLDRVVATARITREQNTVEVRLEIPIQLLLGKPQTE